MALGTILFKTCQGARMESLTGYSKNLSKGLAGICHLLQKEIEGVLTGATVKLYYSMPVWFIDENPIVGYKASVKNVTLLFWSGRSFEEKELRTAGKFKAAQIKYSSVDDIDIQSLRRWLEKSKIHIWDYRNIRSTGKLKLLKKGRGHGR
jgi:hypothetical protein